MVNPEFVEREGMQLEEEACLSVPGFNATVVRPARVVVRGLDRSASVRQHEGTGLLARAFSHEMDHLDGKMFVDCLRGIKRDVIVRRIRKLTRDRQMVKASSLRVLFFGTPAFARADPSTRCFSRTTRSVGVVTQPDRPRGRGHRIIDPPLKICAIEANLPILQPATLEDPVVLGQLAALGADLGVVVAYGRVLSDAVLATPRLGLLNVHPSLLPRHRGAAPVHHAVMAGDTETGVTIMRVVKALDAGPILTTVRRRIATDETSVEVERDLAQMGRGTARSDRGSSGRRRAA